MYDATQLQYTKQKNRYNQSSNIVIYQSLTPTKKNTVLSVYAK
jgi:hypothetical protein